MSVNRYVRGYLRLLENVFLEVNTYPSINPNIPFDKNTSTKCVNLTSVGIYGFGKSNNIVGKSDNKTEIDIIFSILFPLSQINIGMHNKIHKNPRNI